ncbi:MAG: LysM peptidoglycan-binding domain-containing protein [Treponema sp.]|jgi:membrane-bound lytic murein transglycosylase D|nr:LysM peptidoglycan-binding domain-containing protein [Treponema sp.]
MLRRTTIFAAAAVTVFLGAFLTGAPQALAAAEPAALATDDAGQITRPLRMHPPQVPVNRPPHRPETPFVPENSLLLLPGALDNPLTQRYIRHNATPGGRASLAAIMRRGGPYLAFIRQKIAYFELPMELIYLPIIESAYLRTATSRSGAHGLWQFMENSIAPFNIRVTEWMDQRRDFWKSTDGALRKLRGNYRVLGDWPLALAAYNAGLGGVRRLIQSSGVNNYWELSSRRLLRDETINFVPRIIAASYVLQHHRRFGIQADWPENPNWQRVPVGSARSVDLNILAEVSGVDAAHLRFANLELVYNITPPESGFYIKVRGEDAPRIAAALAQSDVALLRYHFHTIRSGDTLLALARHYGISVNQIHASNPGLQERYLRIGNRLRIPAFRDNIAPFHNAVPAHAPEPVNIAFNGTHQVQRGDTLWSLARSFEIAPELLAYANGMQLTDVLREGRVIKTPIR